MPKLDLHAGAEICEFVPYAEPGAADVNQSSRNLPRRRLFQTQHDLSIRDLPRKFAAIFRYAVACLMRRSFHSLSLVRTISVSG